MEGKYLSGNPCSGGSILNDKLTNGVNKLAFSYQQVKRKNTGKGWWKKTDGQG